MENFDQFWQLLPKKDADIYFELRNYVESPSCETDVTHLFKPSTHRYILVNLLEHPYPMCQIVSCFPPSIYMQLYYEALKQIVEFSPQQMLANKHNLYSFLINIHLSDKWLEKCETDIYNRIFEQIDGTEYWELPLVLLVSKSLPLIDAYNAYLRNSYENDPLKKQNAFLMTTKRNVHFFEAITSGNGTQDFIKPDFLCDVTRLVKLAILVSNKPLRTTIDFNFYQEVWKLFDQINASNLDDNQKIVYYEFARMLSLHRFVRSNRRYEYLSDSIALKVLASKYNILDFFVKFNDGSMIANTNDYHHMRKQLVENGVFNAAINANIVRDTERPSEVHIYDQFFTINLMIEVLLIRPMTRNYEDIMQRKSAEIKKIIENIDDPLAFIETIEYLFMLLFLRWEHVRARCFSNSKLDQSTSATTSVTHSDSSYESSDNASVKRTNQMQSNGAKNGFVCTFTILKYMLDALSSALANRKIDECSESLKSRFKDILSAITDAKWRLQLVDLYYIATNSIQASSDLKMMLTARTKELSAKVLSSSDESENCGVATIIRRKPHRRRHRRRKIRKNDSNTHSNATDCKTKSSLESETASTIRYGSQRDRRKCFMSKMLGQFTDMVGIAVIARNDLTMAKGIIEEHNLSDSTIAAEVDFLENFNATKQKIDDILKSQANASEIDSFIEQEIDQFKQNNPVPETQETSVLLDRFIGNYPYLELYKGLTLQAVVIIDYILNLPATMDTSSIIEKMLPKLWDKEEPIEQRQNRIGYYGFIRQILSAQSLCNINRDHPVGLNELLSSELYSFNAFDLAQRLQKEDTYKKQQQIPLDTLNSRAGLIENIMSFENYSRKNENLLQHVFAYSINMNRLIQLKSPPIQLDSDNVCLEEILKIDLFSLIGDIMFDESANVALSDIESIVCNLNTNLLHVITTNTCPTISIRDKFSPSPIDDFNEILQLLAKDQNAIETNQSKSRSKSMLRKPFKIKRNDIIHYVRQHNELMAYLLMKIHGYEAMESEEFPRIELNCRLLDNIMQMEELSVHLESDTDDVRMVAALNFDSFGLDFIRELILQEKFRSALRLLQFCQEHHRNRFKNEIQSIEDALITKVLEDNDKTNDGKEFDLETFTLIEHINDVRIMSHTLLKYINQISEDELALHLTRTVLLHNKAHEQLPVDEIEQLQKYLTDITLFASIGRATAITELLPCDTWTKVMEINRLEPARLLFSLIERSQYEICYQWLQTGPLQNITIRAQFIDLFMGKIQDVENTRNQDFIKVCKILLKILVVQMDSNLLLKLKNQQLLQYLVDFLIENSSSENQIYTNYKITLSIFEVIDPNEVDTMWDLVEKPLLIIEQYIINSKFEKLTKILQTIRPQIKCNECSICKVSIKNDDGGEGCSESNEKCMVHERDSNVDYKDHTISNECIDHILRIYAAKALDFHMCSTQIMIAGSSTLERSVSLDSLCGTFVMPREAPDKSNWVKDIEAKHCMCCKRSAFSLVTRRHHCRRCGRVVCHSCSSKRMLIPKLYDNVMVRVCEDCFKQTNGLQNDSPSNAISRSPSSASRFPSLLDLNQQPISTRIGWIYRFTGQLKHDNLLRDEFSFEYAPSASLCLNIISMHTPGQECCDFLLSYCKKFEALLKPLKPGHANPEVDYAFVTRILYCLSFAAKMHGGTSNCVEVRDHAEIINAVVRNSCESLLPMESINTKSLRTLRDNLVVAEKFSLAIEISLKSGLELTGVMAAWGIACIKAGCFETAREKFVHCLTQTTCDEDCRQILHFLTTDDQTVKNQGKISNFKSTHRSPKVQPLLFEILAILETTCHPVSSNVLQKSSSLSQSNRSLLSMKFGKKEKYPIHEPAVNILHTLSNLKQISHGKYSVKTHQTLGLTGMENMSSLFASDSEQHGIHSRFYTESIYYLVRYGRHIDILRFLIKYKQVPKALKYSLFLCIPADQFIQMIIMPYLKSGRMNVIIQQMIDMDATLMMWKDYIIQICLMLEKRNLLNSLYQVQLLLKDTIRASMTCVRFYAINCTAYQDLRNNVHHLMNAQQHLISELELCQWEEIKTQTRRTDENQSFVMKMDPKSLNQHINTIAKQIDASKFLANCEESGKETISLIPKISLLPCTRIPTLFGSTQDKVVLVALILICGANIEDGFGLAYRIIQDMSLNSEKIYAIVTKYLALNNRLQDVEKLVACIKSNSNQTDNKLCDEILSLAIQSALSSHNTAQRTKAAIENLIRLIVDVSIQIECHILSGQLKAAYLLAVQHKRVPDIRRILRFAEKSNQTQIKKLCEKKLMSIDAQQGGQGHSSGH